MNRTLQPEVQELVQFNILPPKRTVMPNGVPLTVINAGEQDVVRVDTLLGGGRWQQSKKPQALFVNRMLCEGFRKYTTAEIAERLDYYGAWLELFSSTEYAYVTLYSLNKYFAETLDVLKSIIKEPPFSEKELNTVIDANVQQYLVNTSKVDFLAYRSLPRALYGEEHPCGCYVEEADYHNTTPDLLREFYNTYYHSGNCYIYFSGGVTDEIIRRIEAVFGTVSFDNHQQRLAKREYPFVVVPEKRIFMEREDAMQSAVKLGITTTLRTHPDYLRLRVLTALFGGYSGSRLVSNIREDKGYTYGISAGIMFYPGNGLLGISAETANEYVESLIQEVYKKIDKLQNDRVVPEELVMVRNYMLGKICRSHESPFLLADARMSILTSGLDDVYFARSLQAVKEVTPEEIRELAGRYLCRENLKKVIAGKKLA